MYLFMERKRNLPLPGNARPHEPPWLGLDILAVVDTDLSPVVAYSVTETGERKSFPRKPSPV